MIALICIFLPPVFLVFFRRWLLWEKHNCVFEKVDFSFVKEYLFCVLFMNFAVLAVAYLLFGHYGPIVKDMEAYTGFSFHYICLMIAIAVAEPVIENIIRFHVKIKGGYFKFNINWTYALYIFATILGLIYLIRIFDNCFWGDETATIYMAQMSVREMIRATSYDVHPPLYYLFTQLICQMFGNVGITYHLSAFVPYIGIMILTCTYIRKEYGKVTAFVMVTLISLTTCSIQFNIEARMYAFASLLVLIAYLELYRIICKDKAIDWICFAVASLGAAYTHYYALIAVAFFYVMLFAHMFVIRRQKKWAKKIVLLYALTFFAYLPWLMILIRAFERTAEDWWLSSLPTVWGIIIFLFDYKWMVFIFIFSVIAYVLYKIQVIAISYDCSKQFKERVDIVLSTPTFCENESHDLFWIISGLASIVGTIAVGIILSYVIRPFFVTRYIFPLSAVAYLIFGYSISRLKLKRILGGCVLFGVLLANTPIYINTYLDEKALNHESERFIHSVQPSDDAVIYVDSGNLRWVTLDYYYPKNKHIYAPDILSHIKEIFYDSSEAWLFWSYEIGEEVQNDLQRQGYELDRVYAGRMNDNAYYTIYKVKMKEN